MALQVTVIEEADIAAVLHEGQLRFYVLDKQNGRLVPVTGDEVQKHYDAHHPVK